MEITEEMRRAIDKILEPLHLDEISEDAHKLAELKGWRKTLEVMLLELEPDECWMIREALADALADAEVEGRPA